MPKESYYFPHDYHARADEKTAALIAAHGAAGYGVYWLVIELLHEEEHSAMAYDDKKLRRMAAQVRMDADTFRRIVDDCIELFDLLCLDDGMVTSARVLRNKQKRMELSEKRRQAGSKGGRARAMIAASAIDPEANAMQTPANTTKEKESKEKETESSIAAQLIQHCPGLSPAQAQHEAASLQRKQPRAGPAYIARWAANIAIRPRSVVMKSPLGGEAVWTEEEYEKQKDTTDFKFIRYED